MHLFLIWVSSFLDFEASFSSVLPLFLFRHHWNPRPDLKHKNKKGEQSHIHRLQKISVLAINHYLENNASCSQLRRILKLHFPILHSKSHHVFSCLLNTIKNSTLHKFLWRQLYNIKLFLLIFLKTATFKYWTQISDCLDVSKKKLGISQGAG